MPVAGREGEAGAPRAREGEVALIVEDDEAVRDSTIGLIEELGYSVLAARNSAEALELLRGSARVDLLFTDIVLRRGLDGRALALEARALRPALPVLFTTGYTENAIRGGGRLEQFAQFLAKPYTQEQLAVKIRATLDAAGAQSSRST